MSSERWKPVVGYEGRYEVSDQGQVRSLDRVASAPRRGGKWVCSGRILKPWRSTGKQRRKCVTLKAVGIGRKNVLVHRLVLEAFVGPCPKGMEGCHGDGVPWNCALSNLRWDTKANNMKDKLAHGTHNRGERHPLSKITATCVERIRDMRRAGCTMISIAQWLGVRRQHVGKILAGQLWAHT